MRCARRNDHHPSAVEHVLFAGHSDIVPYPRRPPAVPPGACGCDRAAVPRFRERYAHARRKNSPAVSSADFKNGSLDRAPKRSEIVVVIIFLLSRSKLLHREDFNIATVLNRCGPADSDMSAGSVEPRLAGEILTGLCQDLSSARSGPAEQMTEKVVRGLAILLREGLAQELHVGHAVHAKEAKGIP